MTQDVDMSDFASPISEAVCKNVTCAPLSALSRRIGQRYGFASVGLNRGQDFALLGGSVHFEFSHTQTKGDIERGNPVPFSQVHCVGAIRGNSSTAQPFTCSLLSIKSATDLPCPRLYHSASRLSVNSDSSSVVIFGGQAFSDKRKIADIWVLELSEMPKDSEARYSGEWHELAPASRTTAFPPPRSMHATSSCGDTLIVSGGSGFEDTVLGDMWVAQVSSDRQVVWKRVNSPVGKVPCPRRSHALSPMVSEIELMLYGGIDASGNILCDLWIAQFVNDEKSRCVWTELVSGPTPRAGHILFPAFSVNDPKGIRHMMVFGGAAAAADRYNIDTGAWSTTQAFTQGKLDSGFTAVEVDVTYTSKEAENVKDENSENPEEYAIPSVVMIPDSVTRTAGGSPWIASIFATDLEGEKQGEDEKPEKSEPTQKMAPINIFSETDIAARRYEYRTFSDQVPSLPPQDLVLGALVQAAPVSSNITDLWTAQSPFYVVDYLVNSIWEGASVTVSASSWSGGNPDTCHVLVTGSGATSACFSTLDGFRDYINSESTVRAITETCNSCLIVLNGESGDRFVALVSPSLQKHSGAGMKLASPVISVRLTPYAEVQATLRLLQIYTPFRSNAAVQDLFSLFEGKTGGFLLIDFDGTSHNRLPVLAHHKPVIPKEVTGFWSEAISALMSQRPRIEQYALTSLNSNSVAINGVLPSAPLYTVLKGNILGSPVESKAVPRIGHVLIGKLKQGNIGILLYSNTVLVRHLRGRFPFADEPVDELEDAVYSVTGIVDVGDAFSTVAGGLSDFHEAVTSTPEWNQFVTRVEEMCFVYAQRGTLN